MFFKRKSLVIITLLFISFICCTGAITHEAIISADISYDVQRNSYDDKCRIVFGPISNFYQEEHHDGTITLGLHVVIVCKKERPTTIVFDGIEYDYDESAATLTITRVDKSLYATAQQFIITALNLENIDDIISLMREIKSVSLQRLAIESTQLRIKYDSGDPLALKRYNEIQAEEAEKNPLPTFSTKPLKKVIFKGNIVRIGDNFCNAHDYFSKTRVENLFKCPHFSQLETIDMSQSNISEICIGAFPGCTGLRSLIFPESGSLRRISLGAFEGAPINRNYISTEVYQDPRLPRGEATKCCPGCIVS